VPKLSASMEGPASTSLSKVPAIVDMDLLVHTVRLMWMNVLFILTYAIMASVETHRAATSVTVLQVTMDSNATSRSMSVCPTPAKTEVHVTTCRPPFRVTALMASLEFNVRNVLIDVLRTRV